MRITLPNWLIVLLIMGNMIGVLFGFTYWYGAQLLENPIYLWPLIPVSPLYAGLFVIALVWLLQKKQVSNLFLFVTSTGLIKYGIWTIFFWLTAKDTGLHWLMIVWLVVSHLFMAFEALILMNYTKQKVWMIPVTIGWFFANDYVHYFRGLLTNKIVIQNVQAEMIVALVLTIIVPCIIWLGSKQQKVKVTVSN